MKCIQIGCDNVATHRVYWPGTYPVDACKAHVKTAKIIAAGLKINIRIEELSYESARKNQSNSENTKDEVH